MASSVAPAVAERRAKKESKALIEVVNGARKSGRVEERKKWG